MAKGETNQVRILADRSRVEDALGVLGIVQAVKRDGKNLACSFVGAVAHFFARWSEGQ